jgi:hypothetical protein
MALRDYEERKAKGETPIRPYPDDVNCDLDSKPPREEEKVRPSDLIIGAAMLLPAAVKLTKKLRRKTHDEPKARRAA